MAYGNSSGVPVKRMPRADASPGFVAKGAPDRRSSIVDRKAVEEAMEKIHQSRQQQAEMQSIAPMRRGT